MNSGIRRSLLGIFAATLLLFIHVILPISSDSVVVSADPAPGGIGGREYDCGCEEEGETIYRLTHTRMISEDIRFLQEMMTRLGYSIEASGVFNEETERVVRRLQRDYALPVNGIVDQRTMDAIVKAYNSLTRGAMQVSKAAPTGRVSIVIDVPARTLMLFSDNELFKSYPVAVGKTETPSPAGDWYITDKGQWGGGFGTRWLGLSVTWGRYGIHGTNKPGSIGRAASHGCIRMFNSDVEELFTYVTWGTPVKIISGPYGLLGYYRPTLKRGMRGPRVMEAQYQLRDFGYYTGAIDGVFGYAMQQAVINFQKDKGLNPTGDIDGRTHDMLGIFLFE